MNLLSNTLSNLLPSMHFLGKFFVCLNALLILVFLSSKQAYAANSATQYADNSATQSSLISSTIALDFIQKAESGTFQASIHGLQIITSRQPVNMDVEIVATEQSRARGLMFRFDLPEKYGMLFVFPDTQQRCFWMKNTYIPLSIAYINEQGVIVSIHDMQPHDTSSVCSLAPAMFALEVKQGWFAQNHITAGDTVRIRQH